MCAALTDAASAVACYCLRGARRRGRQRVEWGEQVTSGLLDLDDDLDRMRAVEQEWLRRHR
jgi:hypothetical protein